jgi:hypothetical protein
MGRPSVPHLEKRAADQLAESRTNHLSLLSALRENRRKLNECNRHRFPQGSVRLGQTLQCTKCHGTMSRVDAEQYIRGYIAAGGRGDDIWPGWKP